jgi:hypothetical protein
LAIISSNTSETSQSNQSQSVQMFLTAKTWANHEKIPNIPFKNTSNQSRNKGLAETSKKLRSFLALFG